MGMRIQPTRVAAGARGQVPRGPAVERSVNQPPDGVQDLEFDLSSVSLNETDVVDSMLAARLEGLRLGANQTPPELSSGGMIGRAQRAGLSLHAQTRMQRTYRQSNTAEQGESALHYARDIASADAAASAFFDLQLARARSAPAPSIQASDAARLMYNNWAAPFYDRPLQSSALRQPGVFRTTSFYEGFYEELFALDPNFALHYATCVMFGSNPTIASVPALVRHIH